MRRKASVPVRLRDRTRSPVVTVFPLFLIVSITSFFLLRTSPEELNFDASLSTVPQHPVQDPLTEAVSIGWLLHQDLIHLPTLLSQHHELLSATTQLKAAQWGKATTKFEWMNSKRSKRTRTSYREFLEWESLILREAEHYKRALLPVQTLLKRAEETLTAGQVPPPSTVSIPTVGEQMERFRSSNPVLNHTPETDALYRLTEIRAGSRFANVWDQGFQLMRAEAPKPLLHSIDYTHLYELFGGEDYLLMATCSPWCADLSFTLHADGELLAFSTAYTDWPTLKFSPESTGFFELSFSTDSALCEERSCSHQLSVWRYETEPLQLGTNF